MTSLLQSLQGNYSAIGLEPTLARFSSHATILAGILFIAVAAYFLTRWIVFRGLLKLVNRSANQWDNIFHEQRVFHWLCYLIPGAVIYLGASIMFPDNADMRSLHENITAAAMLLIGARVLTRMLDSIIVICERIESLRDRPVKSYMQVAKIVVYIFAVVLVISILLNKSPWGFLSGLGALTALVMLVFRDSILGLVSSVQLASYDMVRRGDWIEMPQYNADGAVIDISLNVVKIQNWDNTISTIPTRVFIAESFKNWRGMAESGGRRIKRCLYIDINTIRFCDENLLATLKAWENGRQLVDKASEQTANPESVFAKKYESEFTNLSLYVEYIASYLAANPAINHDMTCLVRQLAPSSDGLPIELYAFSAEKDWEKYEAIQGDIVDHLLAVLPRFGLAAFQNPTGRDFKIGDFAPRR